MECFLPTYVFSPKISLGNYALVTMKMSDSQYKILNSLGTPNNFLFKQPDPIFYHLKNPSRVLGHLALLLFPYNEISCISLNSISLKTVL